MFRALTTASGTAAPDSSLTVPRIVPRSCARADLVRDNRIIEQTSSMRALVDGTAPSTICEHESQVETPNGPEGSMEPIGRVKVRGATPRSEQPGDQQNRLKQT